MNGKYVFFDLLLSILLVLLFPSCEKAESPVTLPPKGSARLGQVHMGTYYQNQVFFDFETGQEIMTSPVSSWDFAFEASEDGFHVFMNGGKNIFVYNTHLSDPLAVSDVSAYSVTQQNWAFDAPDGLPSETGVGNWLDAYGDSRNEVYIVMLEEGTYMKMVLSAVDKNAYTLKFGDINSASLSQIRITKDPAYSYVYFSFDNGGIQVFPEPPKDSWDIVFTRYRYIFYELENMPYLVTGALLNPWKTTAMADSISGFGEIDYDKIIYGNFSNHRDVIGFDWKEFDFGTGKYITFPQKCYVVKTRKDQYWKIRFTDFYNKAGEKGSPSFEYERVQ